MNGALYDLTHHICSFCELFCTQILFVCDTSSHSTCHGHYATNEHSPHYPCCLAHGDSICGRTLDIHQTKPNDLLEGYHCHQSKHCVFQLVGRSNCFPECYQYELDDLGDPIIFCKSCWLDPMYNAAVQSNSFDQMPFCKGFAVYVLQKLKNYCNNSCNQIIL